MKAAIVAGVCIFLFSICSCRADSISYQCTFNSTCDSFGGFEFTRPPVRSLIETNTAEFSFIYDAGGLLTYSVVLPNQTVPTIVLTATFGSGGDEENESQGGTVDQFSFPVIFTYFDPTYFSEGCQGVCGNGTFTGFQDLFVPIFTAELDGTPPIGTSTPELPTWLFAASGLAVVLKRKLTGTST